MDSVELYRQLLGLTAPWTVERVELNMERQHVEVHVGHPSGQRFGCPECGRELGVYDHVTERVWRHLDSCQFLTYLHAKPPRVSCPDHGVHQVTLPWAQAGNPENSRALTRAGRDNFLLSNSDSSYVDYTSTQDARKYGLTKPEYLRRYKIVVETCGKFATLPFTNENVKDFGRCEESIMRQRQ